MRNVWIIAKRDLGSFFNSPIFYVVTTVFLIIYSFILTSLFYVPGLVFTLAHLTIKSRRDTGSMVCDQETGECVDMKELEAELEEKRRLDAEEAKAKA